ncbi:STAS/SEC14 domain-containing protein [Litorimonas sp. WD9-15]|uniref:STAS/SEC14 domain-containing protein n=1 Tax=Litorimonas sp. WD9-15 TaxID=3418716 RepID=UPI003D0847BA
MKALKTENLELTLDDNVVQMSVTGAIAPESLQSSFDWIETVQSANDNIQLCVEMQSDDFSDLAEASQQFRRVGDVLRRAHDIERCAVVTDSSWLRNSAKVEGAVIPGMNIMAFSPDEADSAGKWLRDEPLLEPEKTEPETAIVTPQSPQKAVEVPPSPPVKPENPWDNFSVKNVDL